MSEPFILQKQRTLFHDYRAALNVHNASIQAANTKRQQDDAAAQMVKTQADANAKARLDAEVKKIAAQQSTIRAQFADLMQLTDRRRSEAANVLQQGTWKNVLSASAGNPPNTSANLPNSSSSQLLTTISALIKNNQAEADNAYYALSKSVMQSDNKQASRPVNAAAFFWLWVGAFLISFIICLVITASVLGASDAGLSLIIATGAATILVILGNLANQGKVQRLRALYTTILDASADAHYWQQRGDQALGTEKQSLEGAAQRIYQQEVAQSTANYQRSLTAINGEYQRAELAANQQWQTTVAQFKQGAAAVATEADQLTPPWKQPLWQSWQPLAQDAPSSPVLRLGEFQLGDGGDALFSPALFPLPGDYQLLFEATGASKGAAVGAIQSLLLHVLAALPPNRVIFTLIDPVGLGQNVAALMPLADFADRLITGQAWTDPQHIEQKLLDLADHTQSVIQKNLRTEYKTVEDYNKGADEISIPYHVLVVLDFPNNFSEIAARRLVSLATNGPRCGVYTIVLHDTAQPKPHGFNIQDLEAASRVIAWDGKRFQWNDKTIASESNGHGFNDHCLLSLQAPPPQPLAQHLVEATGQEAKKQDTVTVTFERMLELFGRQRDKNPADYPGLPMAVRLADETSWWQGKSPHDIVVPLGREGAMKITCLDLGKNVDSGTAHHVLAVGQPGSGKSTMLHTLIMSGALTYSPEELELYLIDFKAGVEFEVYATHQLPHARVIAIHSEREFALSVLDGLYREFQRRGELFRQAHVTHISDYRQGNSDPMPRILLIVDEFLEFFTENDTISSQAATMLDELVRLGRFNGIHVMLVSQTLGSRQGLSQGTLDQMAVRIAFQCNEAVSRQILADDNPGARLLSRRGEAIYNADNGKVEANHAFQTAFVTKEQRILYLEQLRIKAARAFASARRPVVFEGDKFATITTENQLVRTIEAPSWPVLSRTVPTWLGDPIAIRDEPIAAPFRKQSGSNLMIIGQNEDAAISIVATGLMSLAAHYAPKPDLQFLILDFTIADSPYEQFFGSLQQFLPHHIEIGRRREMPQLLNDLATEVRFRQSISDQDSASPGSAKASRDPIYVIVYGLQGVRDFAADEQPAYTPYGEAPPPPSPTSLFSALLRDGPEVDIHTIVWCDTFTNLNRRLDPRTQREFALHVAMQMTPEDSSRFMDGPAASKLGSYRALFSNEDVGRLEKFRPYVLPSNDWFKDMGQKLRSK